MWYLPKPTLDTIEWYIDKFLNSIKTDIQNSSIKKSVKEILLPNKEDDIIKQLLIAPPEVLYPLNERLEKQIESKGAKQATMKKICKVFNYDGRISRSRQLSYDLVKRIGSRTCVYCNRIYSFTVDEISRPDFDHWMPKEKHPLISMSLYNLIPSCPICNRSIKLRKEFKYGIHVHPYQHSEMSLAFQYAPLPENMWKLTLANGTPAENKTAELLKIEEIYTPYANNEVKDLLEFAYKNPPDYLRTLYNQVMKSYGGKINKEQAYRVVFGVEMRPSLYLDRPLSKMKKDVLKQLQNSLGINIIDFD